MSKSDNVTLPKVPKPVPLPTCGIVMPISEIDGCGEGHWLEVFNIISDAVREAGFEPKMVSASDDVGVIQGRIIQNLYDNPIVVCDVSGKNPNVMFELGIRLAFDKPTIIVKDDKTNYSFDTSPIEHVGYPRDLRFFNIVEFKKTLQSKIKKTHEAATKDSNYSTFLKHFGKFTVAKIETQEVSRDEYIMEELKAIREMIAVPKKISNLPQYPPHKDDPYKYVFHIMVDEEGDMGNIYEEIRTHLPGLNFTGRPLGSKEYKLTLSSQHELDASLLNSFMLGLNGINILKYERFFKSIKI